MGSKRRIWKDIAPLILSNRKKGQCYVEPFCGGCNSLCNVEGWRLASDINPYLIAMLIKGGEGWVPSDHYSRTTYEFFKKLYRKNYNGKINHLIGYIGFSCSFRGMFFNSFIDSYLHKSSNKIVNPQKEYRNSFLKTIKKVTDVEFKCCSYDELIIPDNSIIYCDPPYRNVANYQCDFDYDKFYNWLKHMKSLGHSVYISEYWMPEDFKCIWQKEVVNFLGNYGHINSRTEKLFTI